ncbi:hypothetical protein [Halobacterium yunchengense]|uniref:hypothetical protein n=1 Tax=Halobacterium yunchengense TaxID=3108497 RepID=UPI0030083A6E
MNDYERQALHASVLTLAAAALAYAAALVKPPGPDVAAVFGIAAVLLLSAYYVFGGPRRLAGAWASPTVAAVLALASATGHELRLAAIALAALSVLGFVAYPVTAAAARLGERAGDYLR